MTTPAGRSRFRLYLVLGVLAAGVAALVGRYWYVTRPTYRFDQGRLCVARGDRVAALSYVAALKGAGETTLAALLHGEALLSQDSPAEALDALSAVPQESPLAPQVSILAGRCLAALGRPRQAYEAFAFALNELPDALDAHRGLAAIAYDLGDLSRAATHLRAVARLEPSDGRPLRLLGLIHMDLGNDELAEKAYRDALAVRLDPVARAQVRLELASVLLRLTQFDKALAQLDALAEEARGAAPAAAVTRNGAAVRAEALWRLGRADEALAILDQALVEYPEAGEVLSLRGRIRRQQKMPAPAAADLERAAALLPGDYQTHFQLAQAYEAVGRGQDAARARARADEIKALRDQLSTLSREAMHKPFDAPVRVRLGQVYEKLGQANMANMFYRAAQSLEMAANPKPP